MPSILVRILAAFLVATFASAASCSKSAPAYEALPREKLVIHSENGAHAFTVELANDDATRRTGLMFRRELADDAGMIFDFETPQTVSMWMKNTLIPLDMAFIRADGTIARIADKTIPRSLRPVSSGEEVLAVLEVRGGRLAELDVREGDRVSFPQIFKKN
ncbi:MAG: DUF192 domain-containing protein [Parvularculaceae bacterium]